MKLQLLTTCIAAALSVATASKQDARGRVLKGVAFPQQINEAILVSKGEKADGKGKGGGGGDDKERKGEKPGKDKDHKNTRKGDKSSSAKDRKNKSNGKNKSKGKNKSNRKNRKNKSNRRFRKFERRKQRSDAYHHMCKPDNIDYLSDHKLDICKDAWFDECRPSERSGSRDDEFCNWIGFRRQDSSPSWSSPDGEEMFGDVFDAAGDGESYAVPDEEEEIYEEKERRNLRGN